MRILFITGSFPPIRCGIGDYTALLTRELSRREGLEIAVLTSSNADTGAAGLAVEVHPLLPAWSLMYLIRVIRFVRHWQPELVHIQFPTSGYGRGKMPLLLPLVLGWMKIPVVQTWHEPLSWIKAVRYLPCAVTRDALVTVERDYSRFIPAWLWRLLQQRKTITHVPVGLSVPVVQLTDDQRTALLHRYGVSGRLIVYFGFAIASKGIEELFTIADPTRDSILLLCDLSRDNDYQAGLLDLIAASPWQERVRVTGYLEVEEIAHCLAAADVAIFPFKNGMTDRNTSVLAARAQGTFVVTTSLTQQGYCEGEHTWYARPGDVSEMRSAVDRYAGTRKAVGETGVPDWNGIAAQHAELYQRLCAAAGEGR